MTPTRRDLARVGYRLGDREQTNGRLFKVALRAMASPQAGTVGTPEWREFVESAIAGEIAASGSDPPGKFAETMIDVYDIETMGDVNDLLGRESYEREGYAGDLAFVAEE